MRVAIRNVLAVLGLGAALITAQGAQAQVVAREIRIGPETKWVNVTHEETVRFVFRGDGQIQTSFQEGGMTMLSMPIFEASIASGDGMFRSIPEGGFVRIMSACTTDVHVKMMAVVKAMDLIHGLKLLV